jgi:hypothetical protein
MVGQGGRISNSPAMNPKQISLFDREQPTELECSGSELAALLASLRERGAVVLCLAVTCISSYRLTLAWPELKQKTLRQPVTENALTQHPTPHPALGNLCREQFLAGYQTATKSAPMSPKIIMSLTPTHEKY